MNLDIQGQLGSLYVTFLRLGAKVIHSQLCSFTLVFQSLYSISFVSYGRFSLTIALED